MPHVIVRLYAGRTEEQKTRLAEAITQDVMAIEEVDPNRWAEKVYRPNIGHPLQKTGL